MAACSGAITVAVATTAIPAAKILKLKAFIKKVGSVKEAAILLVRVSTGEEKLAELGPVLAAIGAELLGIKAIRDNCR